MSENGQSPVATAGNNLGPLYAALANAQAAFPPVERTKKVRVKSRRTGETYEFWYAPLDTIFTATRPALTANGLALTQLLDGTQIVTKLGHSSGAEIESRLPVPVSEEMQQLGSAITYLRRYSIQALLGIAAEEDDDGNAADGNTVERSEEREASPPDPRMLRVGPFGTAPNQVVGALTDKEVLFYLNAAARAIGDPEKVRFKAKNEALRDALMAEKTRRAPVQEAPFAFEGEQPKAGAPTEADRAPLMKKVKALATARKLTDDEKRVLGDTILDGAPLAEVAIPKLVSFVEFLEQPEAVQAWRQAQAKGAA